MRGRGRILQCLSWKRHKDRFEDRGKRIEVLSFSSYLVPLFKQGGTMDSNAKLPETDAGTILFNVDPIIVKDHYEIDYIHSYAQDSPFFAGLAQKKLLGSRCPACGYAYATPRSHCMECGE